MPDLPPTFVKLNPKTWFKKAPFANARELSRSSTLPLSRTFSLGRPTDDDGFDIQRKSAIDSVRTHLRSWKASIRSRIPDDLFPPSDQNGPGTPLHCLDGIPYSSPAKGLPQARSQQRLRQASARSIESWAAAASAATFEELAQQHTRTAHHHSEQAEAARICAPLSDRAEIEALAARNHNAQARASQARAQYAYATAEELAADDQAAVAAEITPTLGSPNIARARPGIANDTPRRSIRAKAKTFFRGGSHVTSIRGRYRIRSLRPWLYEPNLDTQTRIELQNSCLLSRQDQFHMQSVSPLKPASRPHSINVAAHNKDAFFDDVARFLLRRASMADLDLFTDDKSNPDSSGGSDGGTIRKYVV